MRHLRHLPNRAVDLVVGVFDGAERLHWRIVRARAGAFAPIAAAFARRYRAVRDGLAPPDADRIRIGVVPRVLAGAVGLVAIVAVSTALAPSSSSQAVPRPNVDAAVQKAPKELPAASRLARRTALAGSSREAKPEAVPVRAVAPRKDRVSATTMTPAVAHRVVKGARVARVQRPTSPAPVTTPPPPSPQPVAPAPQPPPAGETNDKPPGEENSGPGGGNEGEENGGNEEEEAGGGKDEKDKDKDKDKDEGEDEDEAEDEDEEDDDAPQPPPPPDDKDDN